MSSGTSSAIAPGTILAGKYRVDRLLGQGGMGVVVEARHIQLDEKVALKFLVPEWATHPEASERFLREARAAIRIKNEHVARVTDVGNLPETGSPYMVMEYLEGDDLGKILETKGPFRVEDAVDFLIQGCEAIAEAHGLGIVHRDLKPANLFLTKHPDGSPLVKVLDFGISKTTGQGSPVDSLTRTTATMGSALYMSPEQMQQSRNVDHRTDVYALGVTLYELLAGKQPYYAETLPQLCAEILTGTPTPLRDLRPDVSPEFANVLERAYARDRNVRFQNISEMVFGLAPFAPVRTQGSIDRVARLAGKQPPRAGEPPPGGWGQNQAGHGGDRMVVGPYGGPSSGRAATAFASPGGYPPPPGQGHPSQPDGAMQPYGASSGHPGYGSNPNFSAHPGHGSNPGYQSSGSLGSHELGRSGVQSGPSKTLPIVAAIAAAVVLGGAAAFFALGRGGPKPATTGEPTVAAAPTADAPRTAETTTPAPPASATPAVIDTAQPVASGAPSASASPQVAAPPTTGVRRNPPPPPPAKSTPARTGAPTPPPPPTQPKRDVFGDR